MHRPKLWETPFVPMPFHETAFPPLGYPRQTSHGRLRTSGRRPTMAAVAVNGLPSMTAAVVIRRRKPSCVRREKAMIPVSCSHRRLAIAACTCSGAATASHTSMSGKLNEFISLFAGDTDTPARRANQWRIETEPTAGPSRFGFLHHALDSRENKLACGAALSGSGLMDPPVKVARQVHRGTDRIELHTYRFCADDLNKSILTVGCRLPHRCPWGKHSALSRASLARRDPGGWA
jgi:hypothetical protein